MPVYFFLIFYFFWSGFIIFWYLSHYLASVDLEDSHFRLARQAAVMSTALVSPQRYDLWLKMSKDVKNKKKPYQAH